jgi:hypothetical protein
MKTFTPVADGRAADKQMEPAMSEESRLIIWVRPETEAALIAERLQQIAAGSDERVKVEICPDPDTAQALLRSDGAAILCQIYTSPERFLSRAVRDGDNLKAALGKWMDEARKMLALHRQNRGRSLLFEALHLCRYSDTGLARLGFSSGSVILNTALEDVPQGAPLQWLIAQAHLQSRPDVVDLREELDASAQLLSNDAALVPPLSAELALQDYRAQALRFAEVKEERDSAKNQTLASLESLKVLRAEAASKDLSLQARATEIEALRAERDSLSARVAERDASLQARAAEIDGLRAERDNLSARLAEREASLKARAVEIDGLRTDLVGKDAALGAVRKDISRVSKERDLGFKTRDGRIADLNEAVKKEQGQVQALEAEIERIMNSRSIRITAPLRRLWALFGGRSHD